MSLPKHVLVPSTDYRHYESDQLGLLGVAQAKLAKTKLPILSSFILTPDWSNYFYTPQTIRELNQAVVNQHEQKCQKQIKKISPQHELITRIEKEIDKHSTERLLQISLSPTFSTISPQRLIIPASISNISQAIVELLSAYCQQFFKKKKNHQSKYISSFFPALFFQFQKKSEKSGIIWTTDPAAREKNSCLIKAWWGTPETIHRYPESAEIWKVSKSNYEIIEEIRHEQEVEIENSLHGPSPQQIPPSRQKRRKLTEKEIIELTMLAKKIQQDLFFPQYVIWTKRHQQFYLISSEQLEVTHPMSTSAKTHQMPKPIIMGLAIGTTSTSAKIKIIHHEQDWKTLNSSQIAVTTSLPKSLIKAPSCSGIICETSLEPRKYQHWDIPLLAHAIGATKKLRDHQKVFLDSEEGIVYSDR